jgi:hypothetical protein
MGTAWTRHGHGMGTEWARHGVCELAFRKPLLEHDVLLATSSVSLVCVACKVKGYDPAVRSTHAFCHLPIKTREFFWHFAYHLWKAFHLLLLFVKLVLLLALNVPQFVNAVLIGVLLPCGNRWKRDREASVSHKI